MSDIKKALPGSVGYTRTGGNKPLPQLETPETKPVARARPRVVRDGWQTSKKELPKIGGVFDGRSELPPATTTLEATRKFKGQGEAAQEVVKHARALNTAAAARFIQASGAKK